MYNPVILFVAVLVCGIAVHGLPDFTVEQEADGLLKLDLMESIGLVCHDGDVDAIAKVECKGEGSSSEVDKDDVHESVTPEFAMEMKCKGSEGKLQECDNSIKQYQKCESFVAVHCGGRRRAMNWIY